MAATSQSPDLFNDYDGFVAKFKPKLTTDDCYTPPEVYDAVLDWAAREYGLGGVRIVRPFYPGGDYEGLDYPEGCCVVDNPPFSILAKIVRFYQARGIRFLLFAPGTTVLGLTRTEGVCALCAGAAITYENGAQVNTSFVTNMEPGLRARSAPSLNEAVGRAVERIRRKKSVSMPRYEYPDDVVTAAKLNWYSNHGTDFRIPATECSHICTLDEQRPYGKSIFGRGLLLSPRYAAERAAAERAAAERAAAERAAAKKWELSPRERELQRRLR